CHSSRAEKVRGGLLLDSREGLRRGGERGAAIVPGYPEASLLLRALRHEDAELRMPPSVRLPAPAIRAFEEWIRAGAQDPRDAPNESVSKPISRRSDGGGDGDGAKAADALSSPRWRWLTSRPTKAPPPAVRSSDVLESPIDRFILAKLEETGMRPVGDAAPQQLVRRLWLTLVGLPPPPEEIDAFMSDPSDEAYARLVDRLLASPRFGERFGRHWLDVARFGESAGGGRSILFEDAWRYRDWAIRAFNEDLPFARFVADQIAGDLLEYDSIDDARDAIVATGFLALGPKNLDVQDKELLRMDVVDEQLDTLGRAFLGLSIGCARCHDHKFDPIPTRDYYALAGILRSTKSLTPGNVSGFVRRELPVPPELRERHDRIEAELVAAKRDADRARAELDKARTTLATLLGTGELPAGTIVVDDTKAELTGEWTPSTYTKGYLGERYLHDGDAGKGAKRARYVPELSAGGMYEVRVSYTPGTNRAPRVPVIVRHGDEGAGDLEESVVAVDQTRPPLGGSFVAIGRFRLPAGTLASVTLSNDGTSGHVIADAVAFVPLERGAQESGAPDSVEAMAREQEIAERRVEVANLESRLASLETDLRRIEASRIALPQAVSVAEEETIEDAPIHIRGLVRHHGDVVPRGFLSALPVAGVPDVGAHESGRRELARWLSSPANPLAARVFVNRVWLWIFGEGIVRTPDDFGARGDSPTHRELLDWLAADFIENGGSTKRLVRTLVLSRTFRRSSADDVANASTDPEARLLWRLPRLRLEAEALRDAMLAVSGELDLAMGGPTMDRQYPSEFDYVFDGNGPPFRRSVYLPALRNARPPIFDAFDFANPNLVTGRRTRSTLPTQALYLLNSEFVVDRARQAALRLSRFDLPNDEARVAFALKLALGRAPRDGEMDAALASLARGGGGDDASDADRLERWARLFHALFASVEFRYRS
ncbi:MAG TPA: DUF1553 domain-containing protein, partial [Planctomycetota bacterium]|nr:DUF1553 domain-containing protein [Planctomycetota bacterium]